MWPQSPSASLGQWLLACGDSPTNNSSSLKSVATDHLTSQCFASQPCVETSSQHRALGTGRAETDPRTGSTPERGYMHHGSRNFPHGFCLLSLISNLSTGIFLSQRRLKTESIPDPWVWPPLLNMNLCFQTEAFISWPLRALPQRTPFPSPYLTQPTDQCSEHHSLSNPRYVTFSLCSGELVTPSEFRDPFESSRFIAWPFGSAAPLAGKKNKPTINPFAAALFSASPTVMSDSIRQHRQRLPKPRVESWLISKGQLGWHHVRGKAEKLWEVFWQMVISGFR